MEKIRVGIVSKTYFYVPYWAAHERGLFAAAGLDVETVMLGNTSPIAPLESGELDITIGTPEGVVQNAAAGGGLCIVAGSTGGLSHFVIAQPKFKRIEDLRGATVGILNMTRARSSMSRRSWRRTASTIPATTRLWRPAAPRRGTRPWSKAE